MEQILRVCSDEYDGDETGNHWQVYYVLFQTADDDSTPCYDLYDDDGRGNGTMIARGYHKGRMRSLALKLGDFVEWRQSEARAL